MLLVFFFPEKWLSRHDDSIASDLAAKGKQGSPAGQGSVGDSIVTREAAGPDIRRQPRRGGSYPKGGRWDNAYSRGGQKKGEGWGRQEGWAERTAGPRKQRLGRRDPNGLFVPVDLNSADTLQLMALPGIGSRLANRIVLFRERLGGFCSVTQLSEVYGLPDTVFQKLAPQLRCDGVVRKLDINTADKEALGKHPYIRWSLAGVLIRYRDRHGRFNTVDDLKSIHRLDSAVLRKIEPYLRFQ